MAVCAQTGVGNYQASEGHFAAWERLHKPSAPPLRGTLHAYGYGASYLSYINPADAVTKGMAEAGIPMLGADWGGVATWGNDTAKTRLSTGKTFLTGTVGATSDKVLLYGMSMGALSMLNWARANPTLVAAIALLIPVIDLADMYANNRGGYAASISTAHGGAPPSTHDPAAHAAEYAGIPIKIWYSTDDPICLPASTTAFAATAGAATVSLGAAGHGFGGQYDSLIAPGVIDFLGDYA